MSASHEGYRLQLSISRRGEPPQQHTFARLEVTIGRKAELNHLQIRDGNVSRQHCKISLFPDGLPRVVDLQSTNGVYLNREEGPLRRPRLVSPSDRILLGDVELCVTAYVQPARPVEDALLDEATHPNTSPARLLSLGEAPLLVQRALAARIDAPSSLLSRLAEVPDLALVRRLARNPSTPREVLAWLAPRLPRDFCENPVYSLLQIEDPSFSWLQEGREMFEVLPLDPDPGRIELYRAIAFENPRSSIFPFLRRAPAWWLLQAAERFLQLPLFWEELHLPCYDGRRVELAQHAPPVLWSRLARDPAPAVRASLASCTELTGELAFLLSEDEDPGVRSALAAHTQDPLVLSRLCYDVVPEVRACAEARVTAAR